MADRKVQSRSRNKVRQIRKPFYVNPSVIIFLVILIYILISIVLFFTTKHISIYQVENGSLSQDNSYTGIILRSEKVVNAEYKGNIAYYAREGERISPQSTVYSIDETGEIQSILDDVAQSENSLSDDEIENLRTDISNFNSSFSTDMYQELYQFKSKMQSSVLSYINFSTVEELSNYKGNLSDDFHIYNGNEPGIIEYYIDGYEALTEETFKKSMLEEKDYTSKDLTESSQIEANTPAYKLITSEDWEVLIPLDVTQQAQLKALEQSNIKVHFTKDDSYAWAKLEFVTLDNTNMARLSFTNSMIRFASDRYIDVKLSMDNQEGLKIPVSALVNKDFYTIPIEYFTKGGDSNNYGVLREVYDEDGNVSTEFVETTIYYSDDTNYYVETDLFDPGNNLVKPNSDERYKVSQTATLQGVYCINKGYAVFKQIDIINQNEEYCIVKTGTDYGLVVYDYIVLDGSTVTEDEVINYN